MVLGSSPKGPSLNSVVELPYQRKMAVPTKAVTIIRVISRLRQDFILRVKLEIALADVEVVFRPFHTPFKLG